jgi:TRAP-type C4-dicarboxylate transport system permease small subunit
MTQSDKNSILASLWNKIDTMLHIIIGPIVSVVLFFMMALTFADVVGRYVFNSPITGALELTEFAMAIVIFLGLTLLSTEEGHVTVDLFDNFIPDKIKAVQTVIVNIISAVIVGVISWQLWVKAAETAEYGDITQFLRMPLAPLLYFMSIMTGIASIVMVFIMFKSSKMEK